MKEKYIPDNDYGLGLKVHEDAYRELEDELASAKKQRDRLAEELKEAQDAIEMMLRDSTCRRIPAYIEEQLAAVKGGSHDH
jgi:predicted  nucleic acid-binding Zn-ribbon protein